MMGPTSDEGYDTCNQSMDVASSLIMHKNVKGKKCTPTRAKFWRASQRSKHAFVLLSKGKMRFYLASVKWWKATKNCGKATSSSIHEHESLQKRTIKSWF